MIKQIEGQPSDIRPNWLKNVQAEGTKPGELTINGQSYPFTVVRRGLAPLPYTVGFPNPNALFISEDVPEDRRSLIMTHEVREKTVFKTLPEEARCEAALKAELSDAKAILGEEFPSYARDRRDFFGELVTLYDQPDQQKAVSEEFRLGIKSSSNFLRNLNLAETQ